MLRPSGPSAGVVWLLTEMTLFTAVPAAPRWQAIELRHYAAILGIGVMALGDMPKTPRHLVR